MNTKFPKDYNKEIISIIESEVFEKEIRVVNSMLFMANSIKVLESEDLSIKLHVSCLLSVKTKLSSLNMYQERFDAILARNPDLPFFRV